MVCYSPPHSLTQGHLDVALKYSVVTRNSDELSHNFEEFFLSNADEVAELLKRSPGVSHFQAQQMVCEMMHVSVWAMLDELFTSQ